jgi:hypothetical protein
MTKAAAQRGAAPVAPRSAPPDAALPDERPPDEMPPDAAPPDEVQPDEVLLAVVAAHRTGHPLHHELVALGARFERRSRTAPTYRLIALPGPGVPRGGIVAVPVAGVEIEVELHRLPRAAVGTLLAALPSPLAIGPVELVDGAALGILCAATPPGARDISAHGSWPAYLASGTADRAVAAARAAAAGAPLTTRP